MIETQPRSCRTCPKLLENYDGYGPGFDQCVACSERSRAVRAAVAEYDPLPVLRVLKPSPRVGGCATDGHSGCEHHAALILYLVTWRDEMGMCPVCGTGDEAGDAPTEHKSGCLLEMLENGGHP